MPVKEIRVHKPNEKLIEWLEETLESARKGEIQGIVAVFLWDDAGTSSAWVPPPRPYHVSVNSRRVVGELEYLKHEIMGDAIWLRAEDSQ